MEGRIIHIEFKVMPPRHGYFGSLMAIYKKYPASLLGIAYNSLRNAMTNTDYYENDKIIVRRSEIIRSVQHNKTKK